MSFAREMCPCAVFNRSAARRRRFSSSVKAMQEDELTRCLSDNGQVSVLVVKGTNVVQEACDRHKTSPTASAALGRAILGTLLLASFRGEGERTQISFKGNGPLGMVQVIAESNGLVKGKVGDPSADPPLRPDGKLNVGEAVGRGILAVVRSHPNTVPGFERPYTGMVPIQSGEIAEDLARYLADSEQTQSALALGVSINKDCSVRAAGGYLVQVLPFAEEETIAQLEANIQAAGPVTEMLHGGASARDITERLLQGLGVSDTGFKLTPRFGPCEPSDLKTRMKSAIATLGEKEVHAILEEQGKLEATCEFCKDTYQFELEEVLAMIEETK